MLTIAQPTDVNKIKLPILCVEDDTESLTGLSIILKRKIDVVDIAHDGKEGYEKFIQRRHDIIVTDIRMPRINGIELAEKIKIIKPSAKIIMTTAYSDTEYFTKCIELGVNKYILKPINVKTLISAISLYATQIEEARELELNRKKLSRLSEPY